jgi:glutamate formiminotransferase/formiminotetrahydrofolate cyclodeaminase
MVECIPNFSEARRPEVVEAILAAIRSVPGISILDRHSDTDHNRTVVTYVGAPAAVEEAAFRAIEQAAKLIDLDQHSGAHPRIGATDVVPFVPISDMSMAECIEMARRLGKRVGDTLGIPVYLYEEAANRPERQNLENIRRGQYEALKAEMGINPERDPDFGPKAVGPAGATVIGARQPLVAFNIYLTTDDVSIAKKIASAVRNSSGGLRFVKGMGVLVEGRAQVSMNLTNYRQTPIARVVEFVRREAARYGVGIHHSELVGLIPQEALTHAAIWYTQLDAFEPQQVLETRLFEAIREQPSSSAAPNFLDQLASASPTPGGGSAAAHAGAAAAALVCMVARLTVGKKKYEAVKEQMWQTIEEAETLRQQLNQAVNEDAAAFEAVMNAFKLPKDTPSQQEARNQAIETATYQAAQVPLRVARLAVQTLELAVRMAENGNLNAISDSGSSAALARAALTGAGLNVRINLGSINAPALSEPLLSELSELEAKATTLESQLAIALKQRAGL